jgi:glycosyltransferase involved in cell wall biosynthesis
MRILHVIRTIDAAQGGPVEVVRQLCMIFAAAGEDAEVVSLDSPSFVQLCQFPSNVHALGPGKGVYGYAPQVTHWLKANHSRFDAVVVHGIWDYIALAVHKALVGTKTPYAIFTHGMLDPHFKKRYPLKHLKKSLYWHLFLGRVIRSAGAVYFTCEEEKILARKSFYGYKVREMVVPLGTLGPDCDVPVAAEQFFARWPELRGKRIAIFLGRIHPKKGIDILIQAFADTLAEEKDWHLLIAGPDQIGCQKYLEAIAVERGVQDRITWTGMLSSPLKWGALAASEVFVLPSHQENFGVAIAESLAVCLPVIVSTKVNIWREIENAGAGFVGADTIKATSASLRSWAAIPREEIAGFRCRARRCFEAHFDFQATSKKALEIFGTLASSRPIENFAPASCSTGSSVQSE